MRPPSIPVMSLVSISLSLTQLDSRRGHASKSTDAPFKFSGDVSLVKILFRGIDDAK